MFDEDYRYSEHTMEQQEAGRAQQQLREPSNISPEFDGYELIDSGGGEKLERFGGQIVARPEPQAIWPKAYTNARWDELAVARFEKGSGRRGGLCASDEWGQWRMGPKAQQQWSISYRGLSHPISMRLGLTSFKHVGLFPEQSANWDYIYRAVAAMAPGARVLNLFAYTGGASLAAAAAGAAVTHVDAVRSVVGWARETMERSGLSGIRWIVDDALKFVARERRRGGQYSGIVLDPPAYGRGPDGEKWLIDQHLFPLLEHCSALLASGPSFVVLNLYSLGYSPVIAKNLLTSAFGAGMEVEHGELLVYDRAQRGLPLGVYARAMR